MSLGPVEYFFDGEGRLWKGPLESDDNLHWARFEGFDYCGFPIWVLRGTNSPELRLSAHDLEEFFWRELTEWRAKQLKEREQRT